MDNPQLKKAKFLLRLRKEHFSDNFCCLGEQLVQILTCLQEETKGYAWYLFDLYGSTYDSLERLFPKDNRPYAYFENTTDLIDRVKKVIQFESGIFIAIQKDRQVEWDINFLPETEEDEGLQHPLAEIEIRAFDYSYFEIYGTDRTIETKIKSCFPKLARED